MAFEPSSQRVVVFSGGSSFFASTSDMWAWDGTAWTRVPVALPTRRSGSTMIHDVASARLTAIEAAERERHETWPRRPWVDRSAALCALVGQPILPGLGGFKVALDAMEGLRRQWACELGPNGIRVVTLKTGGVPESLADTEIGRPSGTG